MLQVAVFLCAVLAFASGQTTGVSQCTANPGDLPINTYVEGCLTPPCQLPQLQDAVIHVVFKAPRTVHSMTTLATAYMSLGFITIPVPYDLGSNAVTCNFLSNTYCPVLKDEVVTYTLRMYIESFFPVGTAVTIEFRVVEDQGPILCIRLPITIVSPVEGTSNITSNSTLFASNYRTSQRV